MFRRKRSAADFQAEIEAHLALEADDLKGEGLSADEARWKAQREFGNVRAAQERLQQALGLRVTIEDHNGRGKVIIEYARLEDFDTLLDQLAGE